MKPNQATDEEFLALIELISRNCGIDCGYYKTNYLQRRIRGRMDRRRICSYREYESFLESHPEEYRELMGNIGVNVTEFFRDAPVFLAMRRTVIPDLLERKRRTGDRGILVWSAGCATGEEPYTAAIVLREALGEAIGDFDIRILATDIDELALDTACAAEYAGEKLDALADHVRRDYFMPLAGAGRFRVKDGVRNMVEFRRHDLITENVSWTADMLLCRNMLIYINYHQQSAIFDKFHCSLADGGAMILGRSESLPLELRDKFDAVDLGERIYRKK